MSSIAKAGLVVAGTLAALAIGGVVYIGSGSYNIGAHDHHTKIVLAINEQLRERSIGVRPRTPHGSHLRGPPRNRPRPRHPPAPSLRCHPVPLGAKSRIRAI